MERIKWKEQLPKVPIPADYFDLIGGTSTGGYIHMSASLLVHCSL